MVVLKLLGPPHLADETGPLSGPAVQRHRIGLLAILATTCPRAEPREKLMALLWPDRDAESARNLLKQSAYVLRRALGDGAIRSAGDALRFDASIVHCDAIRFTEAMAAGNPEAAAGLYTGPFLDGFFLNGAPEFETWVEEQRGRLAALYAQALETLARDDETRRDYRSALQRWLALARQDPLHSGAVLGLMRSFESAGDPAAALRHAEQHARLLRDELGIRPPPELSGMVARLQGLHTDKSGRGDDASSTSSPDVMPRVPPSQDNGPRPRRAALAYAAAAALVVVLALSLWQRATVPQAPPSNDAADALDAADAKAMDRRLRGDPSADRPERQTFSIAAHELYVRGNDSAMLRSPAAARQALEYLREAVRLDPSYAAAWAGVARLAWRVTYDGGEDEVELLQLAEEAALRAVELDDSLAVAHATMGLLRMDAFDLPAAESWLKQAIALDPADAQTREWLAGVYLWRNMPTQALTQAERAVRLDPLSPSAAAELARVLAATGRCDEALARLRTLAELQPPLLRVPLIAAHCHVQRGEWGEAIAAFDGVPAESSGSIRQAFLAYAAGRSGPRHEALDLRDALLAEWRQGTGGALPIALLYAGLGDSGQAVEWLERALTDQSLSVTPDAFTLLQPALEQLRGNPRLDGLSVFVPWSAGAARPAEPTVPLR